MNMNWKSKRNKRKAGRRGNVNTIFMPCLFLKYALVLLSCTNSKNVLILTHGFTIPRISSSWTYYKHSNPTNKHDYTQRSPRIILFSSSSSSNNNNNNTPSQQLAQMEDEVEQTLESNQPLNLRNMSGGTNNRGDSILQHTMRAPTTSSSSSNTFNTQELSFENEDEEARKRQSFINKYLEEDDANWKRERLERILGKYKDVLDQDNDEGGKRTMEDRWRQIIEEEKKRIENGMSPEQNKHVLYVTSDEITRLC